MIQSNNKITFNSLIDTLSSSQSLRLKHFCKNLKFSPRGEKFKSELTLRHTASTEFIHLLF